MVRASFAHSMKHMSLWLFPSGSKQKCPGSAPAPASPSWSCHLAAAWHTRVSPHSKDSLSDHRQRSLQHSNKTTGQTVRVQWLGCRPSGSQAPGVWLQRPPCLHPSSGAEAAGARGLLMSTLEKLPQHALHGADAAEPGLHGCCPQATAGMGRSPLPWLQQYRKKGCWSPARLKRCVFQTFST